METVVLSVKGMTCGGCVRSVENVLRAVDGVERVQVSLEKASATIDYDGAKTGTAAFKSVIEDAGYEVVA